jgi:hypothetical protein
MTKSKAKKTSDQKQDMPLEWSTTAIHLPKTTLNLLKLAAFHRAQKHGGRMSVSKLVTEIIESHRKELEQNIADS